MLIKDPLKIEVQRGGYRESLHLVHAVVTDSSGKVVEGWGDIEFLTFPRSAVKPLQAIPLILSGAEERFQMSIAELAMACSSHGAETA
ncbi:MAG: asparaginase, partial [bacterium]